MTESEWLACTNPLPMLVFLQGKARERKLRLFVCAGSRSLWGRLSNDERYVCDVGERYADSVARQDDVETARWLASERVKYRGMVLAVREDITACIFSMFSHEFYFWKDKPEGYCTLLRDIFGNPFYPFQIDPVWITPTVTSLATAAYEDRALSSGELDPARLAVLSDALEEAGCDNPDILAHLRTPGPHVRGCWVVDLLLGKE